MGSLMNALLNPVDGFQRYVSPIGLATRLIDLPAIALMGIYLIPLGGASTFTTITLESDN
jgi:hypothetical protein